MKLVGYSPNKPFVIFLYCWSQSRVKQALVKRKSEWRKKTNYFCKSQSRVKQALVKHYLPKEKQIKQTVVAIPR